MSQPTLLNLNGLTVKSNQHLEAEVESLKKQVEELK